jgi:hypothetical protein
VKSGRKILLPPSMSTDKTLRSRESEVYCLFGIFFDPEDGSSMFLRNLGINQITLRHILEDRAL